MIDDPELHRLFKAESEEHLAHLDDGLLRLEKTPTDPVLLEDMFRESHSLKGAARMLGLLPIETIAHNLETILNAARKAETPILPETIELMNSTLDELKQRVQKALMPDTDHTSQIEDGEQPDIESQTSVPSRPSITVSQAPRLIPESLPSASLNRQPVQPFYIETVRVETRKLDNLLTQVGELSVLQGRLQHRLALLEELQEYWLELKRDSGNRNLGLSSRSKPENNRHEDFGTLLKQVRDAFFDDNAHLEATVNLLSDQVRSIRLLPLSTVFSLFPRMVRDLAKEQGKQAELILEGGDITVDKRILEEMKDPLMHLLRNAIDHGIEAPAERERLAKPCSGTVRITATREHGNVLLKVQDDGCGLNLTAIRQKALQCKLYDEATLTAMMPEQLQQLIFTPEFSTSAYVTELSGRGVGLDVVRVNVERIKGNIHLESVPGCGLTVTLKLPLSLATSRILLADVNHQVYGLPIEFIYTSLQIRTTDVFTLEGRSAILLDGRSIIVARLADLLELPAQKRDSSSDILTCVVLQAGVERLGLLIDELLTEEEVMLKPLGAPLQRVRNVASVTILGNGEICAVLNPADLLRSAHKTGIQRLPETTKEPDKSSKTAGKPVILLVEDSVLIRAMEKRILEDGGYEVVTAVDGLNAMTILNSRSFAAVVSDVMMPNMNGLALTAHIRAEPRYRELPVILVTTLASDEDKRRGLDAGANAYIPKPSFDQRLLLDALKRLIVT